MPSVVYITMPDGFASRSSCQSVSQNRPTPTRIVTIMTGAHHAWLKKPSAMISACHTVKPRTSHQETARCERTVPRARTSRVSTSCPMKTAGIARKRVHRNAQPPARNTAQPTRSHRGSRNAAGISQP